MNTQELCNRKPKILTWHIHGNYMYYLSQADADFYLPVRADRENGYGGRAGSFSWGDNVHEVAADEVGEIDLDLILFQSRQNYEQDQYEILSEEQRQLPKVYIEHDPPREHPTNTQHIVDDPEILLVHVTHFNELMWDSNSTPTKVINHGVMVPGNATYSGEKNKGIVVVNNLKKRGRRLGLDIFKYAREEVPLDLVGMNSKEVGGLGELPYDELHQFTSQYRFFFNPIRYTSLGLAVCEAMMVGLPVVAPATTEMAVAVENGTNGYSDTDVDVLINRMKYLLNNPQEAQFLGNNAKSYAQNHFSIERFSNDWIETFKERINRDQSNGNGELNSKEEVLQDEKLV